MSSNSIDYSDPRIDAGGDNAYDSSKYGTTTGMNEPEAPRDSKREEVADTSEKALRQGNTGSGTTEKNEEMTTKDAKAVQGYEGTEDTIGA